MGTRIAASDLTWLMMDRPNNLMHVHGLLTFDELPEWDKLQEAIFERIVTKYRVLSQVPVKRRGHWEWVDDVDFSVDRHIQRVILADSHPDTLRAHVSSMFSVPFDRSRPLWDMQLISGPVQDEGGGAMLTRFHHGLGDGIRLVQLLLGTCDPAPDAIPQTVGRSAETGSHGALETVRHLAEHSVKDAMDAFEHSGEVMAQASRTMIATMNPLELPHHLESALDLVRHPTKLIDALTSFTSSDNETSNSWREIGRLLLHGKAETDAWSGHPDVDKGVAWVDGISLDAIKQVAATFNATVNDTLMAAVSLALTDYLTERGVEEITDLAWMMPVSLQPVDSSLPSTLGNHFAVVLFEMPLGIADPATLIGEIHERTTRLKNSAEPAVAFGMQKVIAEAPGAVAKRVTDFFSGKTIGQLSNVPGPRSQLTMVGAPVRTVMGWVPTSGDQPIGVCLFTYNGTVGVGVSSDTRMVPDPERVTGLIRTHIEGLMVAAAERDTAPTPRPRRPRRSKD